MLFGFCALAQKTPRKRTPFFWFVFFGEAKKMNENSFILMNFPKQ